MTGSKMVTFEEGTDPDWSKLYQVLASINGYTKWQRLWSLTGVEDDSSYVLTVRNHGTTGGGRHAQFQHSSTGASVVSITDAGIALSGTITSTPVGSVVMYAGASLPSKWIRCDGTVLSQTTYALLYAAIGTTFNTGTEGAGNFRVPDMRGRFPITVSGSFALGATGGASTVDVSHTHGGGSLSLEHAHSHTHGGGSLSLEHAHSHTHGGGSLSLEHQHNHSHGPGSLSLGHRHNHSHGGLDHNHTVTINSSSATNSASVSAGGGTAASYDHGHTVMATSGKSGGSSTDADNNDITSTTTSSGSTGSDSSGISSTGSTSGSSGSDSSGISSTGATSGSTGSSAAGISSTGAASGASGSGGSASQSVLNPYFGIYFIIYAAA